MGLMSVTGMGVRKQETVVIDCTPDRLREIARILDEEWDKSILGRRVPCFTIHGAGLTVELQIDQSLMAEEREAKR